MSRIPCPTYPKHRAHFTTLVLTDRRDEFEIALKIWIKKCRIQCTLVPLLRRLSGQKSRKINPEHRAIDRIECDPIVEPICLLDGTYCIYMCMCMYILYTMSGARFEEIAVALQRGALNSFCSILVCIRFESDRARRKNKNET